MSIVKQIYGGISTLVDQFFTVLLLIAGLAVLAIAIGPAMSLTSLVTGAAGGAQSTISGLTYQQPTSTTI